MKFKGLMITICFLFSSFVVNAEENQFTILAKPVATYTMSDNIQDTFGIPMIFDEDASFALGADFIFYDVAGVKLGGEAFIFENDFSLFGSQGTTLTLMTMFNARKYFLDGMFKPYIGAGAGVGSVSFNSLPLSGSAAGLNAQFLLGFDAKFSEVFGVFIEYKNVFYADYSGETASGATADFDFSGSGITAGLSIRF